MAHFQFAVSGHVLDLLSPTRGVADGLHVNSAEFEFRSADWDGMVKWAHFSNPEYNDGEQQDFLLEGDEISSARGLNLPSGIWEVYLTGYLISNDEIIRRNLTESQLIMIVPSGFEDNAAISMVEPTFAEQVIARAESAYADRITNATVTVGDSVGPPTAEVVISGQSGTKSLDFHFDNLLSNGIASFDVSETGYVTITLNDGTVTEYDGIERALEEINDLIVSSAQAEEARQFAEAGRVEAENLRVAAEDARAAEFNTWGDIQYTAEAWAVGQRAGVDVDPTDVTYENNAKYWAEYAEEHAGQNQDAFSYVQVGDTTIAADLPQDTLTLIAGDNVTLTPDATNDSIRIDISEDFAPINSPAFTGTPTAPTQAASDDSTKIATTAFVHDLVDPKDGGYGTCSTASGTTAKVVAMENYELVKGGQVVIKFTYAVPANATLNINSQGAKAIYFKESIMGSSTAIDGSTIRAGDICTFVYDGTHYVLTNIDRWGLPATTSRNGLMSTTDKTKLNGMEAGAQVNTVTGVKGSAESSYRTGNIDLSAEDIGYDDGLSVHATGSVGKELSDIKGSLNRLTESVIVDINGNGDYTSILRALKETESYVTVYVLAGTYNIWQEYIDYYGANFWTNYDGYNYSTDPFMRGLWLGDRRKVIGVGNPILHCYNTNSITPVAQYFSVFANGNNTELDGFEIHFTSLRYAIHDDFGLINSRTIWKNLIFYGSSGSIFGGGMGHNSSYLIENCSFYSNNGTYDINYHASTSAYTDNRCHIIVKDCRGNHICKFGYYGASRTKSVCIVINSSFLRVENGMHGTGQTNNNIELYQWVIPPRIYRDNRSTTSYFVPIIRTNMGAWSTFLIWGCVSANTGEFLYLGNVTGLGVNLLPIHVSEQFNRTLSATMADNGMTINSDTTLTGGFSLIWIDTPFGVQPDGQYTVTM